MRKSSVASTWLPEGEGYEVFKTTPSGEPGLANAHKDQSWGRATVENNVRQWFKFMSVSLQERLKIEADWQARFASLPVDGDISTLPEGMKLKWAELPKRASMAAQPAGGPAGDYYPGGVHASSHARFIAHSIAPNPVLPPLSLEHLLTPCPLPRADAMENPPVDPTTGFGRTAADRAADLRAYQDTVRNADAGLPEAVFQGEHLLVQIAPTEPVQFVRVSHNACIAEARADKILITVTQKAADPQAGVHRLFGLFSDELNPDFDAHDRRKGTKYIRHKNVDRSQIKVYNVKTHRVKVTIGAGAEAKKVTKIRIDIAALKKLAAVSDFTLPAVLPRSHQRDIDSSDDEPQLQRPPRRQRSAPAAQARAPTAPAPTATDPAGGNAQAAAPAPAQAPAAAAPAPSGPAESPTTSQGQTDETGPEDGLSDSDASEFSVHTDEAESPYEGGEEAVSYTHLTLPTTPYV